MYVHKTCEWETQLDGQMTNEAFVARSKFADSFSHFGINEWHWNILNWDDVLSWYQCDDKDQWLKKYCFILGPNETYL